MEKKLKTYRVTWDEVYLCAREVEADSEADALEKVRAEEFDGTAEPDQKEFDNYENWGAWEVKDEDEEDSAEEVRKVTE